MPRLFLGNFDFEHQIAEPHREPPEKLKRLNAEMAITWLSIAEDGDWIWIPSLIEPEFFDQAVAAGLPDVLPTASFAGVPRDVECVPWGWSLSVQRTAERQGWRSNAPPLNSVRIANSRATSSDLERRWDVGLDGACRIESLEGLNSAIQMLPQRDARWVVKAEFGMSARERILGFGPLQANSENWVRKRLALNGAVYFEPWVNRIAEFGIQIDVPRTGLPAFIAMTPMLVDQRGQYAGSWFAFSQSRFETDQNLTSQAVDVALRAASHLQSLGYFGPLGIDAMIYRDAEGHLRIRPLQDINARWTMGRLSLGWRKLLSRDEEGCWQHGSGPFDPIPTGMTPSRVLMTSPTEVAGTKCERQSRIIIPHGSCEGLYRRSWPK